MNKNIYYKSFFPENDIFNYLLHDSHRPKIMKYDETRRINDCCPINLTKFDPETNVVVLKCGHCFRPKGLKSWFEKQKKELSSLSCPLCRQNLKISTKRTIQTYVRNIILDEDKEIQEKICSTLIMEMNENEKDADADTDTDT